MKNAEWWEEIGTVQGLCEVLTKPIPEPALILGPWLAEKEIALIHAPSGVGKTFVAQTLAVAAAEGITALHSVGAGVPTLYIDAEMSEAVFQERLQQLCRGLRVDEPSGKFDLMQVAACPPEETFKFPYLDDDSGRRLIKEYVSRWDIKLVVIDNLRMLARATDENSAEAFADFNRFLSELSQLGAASLVIHHNNKGTTGSTYSGNTAIETAVSVRVSIKAASPSKAGNAALEVSVEKNRRGIDCDFTRGFKAELDQETGQWSMRESDTEAQRLEFKRRAELGEFTTQREAADAFGVCAKTIRRWSAKLRTLHDWNEGTWGECTQRGQHLRDIDSGSFDEPDPDGDGDGDLY